MARKHEMKRFHVILGRARALSSEGDYVAHQIDEMESNLDREELETKMVRITRIESKVYAALRAESDRLGFRNLQTAMQAHNRFKWEK